MYKTNTRYLIKMACRRTWRRVKTNVIMKKMSFRPKRYPLLLYILLIGLSAGAGMRCDGDYSAAAGNPGADMPVGNISESLPWSERMALSIIKRNPEAWMVDFRETPKWNYTQGLVMTAMLQLWKKNRNQTYFDYAKSYADTLITTDGQIGGNYEVTAFNIDHIKPGRPLFSLYEVTGDKRYRKAIETLRNQLKWQPRTTDGGFWHKLRYPWQMWLDGLYMGEPFYAEYAATFNEPEVFDEIAQQFILMEKHARDEETGLLYHGWDESRLQRWSDSETGKSECFWGRAIGWYLMALVDVLDHFPQDHPKRAEIIAILNRTAEAIANYLLLNIVGSMRIAKERIK